MTQNVELRKIKFSYIDSHAKAKSIPAGKPTAFKKKYSSISEPILLIPNYNLLNS